MFWRFISALTVLFWAVMTALLVRTTYFAGDFAFAEVPPRYVFDLFLKQAAQHASTLHLHHRSEKIGHASLSITTSRDTEHKTYHLMARGLVERLQDTAARLDVTWEINGTIDLEGNWDEAEFIAAVPREKINARIAWSTASKEPDIAITQNGKPMIDMAQLSILMALGGGLGGQKDGLTSLLAQVHAQQPADAQAMRLTAREGLVEMAGRERKCFIVTIPLLAGQSARLMFAETGEIARIEMPQEYVLLEPMIHGMLE